MDFSLEYLKTVVRISANEKPMTEEEFRQWAIKWINPDSKKIDSKIYEDLVFMWENKIS